MSEKFRPRQFAKFIGQTLNKSILQRKLVTNTLPQVILFHGHSGCGKSSLAEITALAKTCEHLTAEGEPCLKCKSCLDNIKQLDAGNSTYTLKKVNMAKLNKKDLQNAIKEIFNLQPRDNGSSVYILEELHILKEDEQTMFLEEISNIPEGIYLFMCTTDIYSLIEPLTGRANAKIDINKPSTEECEQLVEEICFNKNLNPPKQQVTRWLINSCRNTPREIVNAIDFLADGNELDEELLKNYLGFISDKDYIELFKLALTGDMFEYFSHLETIKDYTKFIKGLYDFIDHVYSYVFGGNTEFFNTMQKKELKEILEGKNQEQLLELLHFLNTTKCKTDSQARFMLINMKRLLTNKSNRVIYSESKKEAVKSNLASIENTQANNRQERKQIKKIDDETLLSRINQTTEFTE